MQNEIIAALERAGGKLPRAQLWKCLPQGDRQPTDAYWQAEQALVDAKRIERRRGRSGGIYIVPPTVAMTDAYATPTREPGTRKTEAEYYATTLKTILDHWTEQAGFKHAYGAVTAGQGSKQTGGRWSRPDIILCTVSEWLFSARPEGDVRTIEVKRFEALDVLGVYEAVSHKTRAHYAYLLVVNFPAQLTADQEADFDGILAVASQHGIGVITARDEADWDTWIFELDPERSNADNQAVHQILLDQVPPETRDSFRTALRSVTVHLQI